MKHFYKNSIDIVFIFQNYVLHIYQQRMETYETVKHSCNVIVMDYGLDACHCQIFTALNKDWYTKFRFLYDSKVPTT